MQEISYLQLGDTSNKAANLIHSPIAGTVVELFPLLLSTVYSDIILQVYLKGIL